MLGAIDRLRPVAVSGGRKILEFIDCLRRKSGKAASVENRPVAEMLAAEPVVGKMHRPSPHPASFFADREIHYPFAALAPSSAIAAVRDDKFKRDLVIFLNLLAMVQNRLINLAPLPLVVGDSSIH